MEESELEKVARTLITNLEVQPRSPESELALVNWKGDIYFGWLQEIYPNYSKEIVLLSKTSRPVDSGLADAIINIRPNIPFFSSDDSLDLNGRYHHDHF